MKHKLSITLLLLAMFLATQFIGIYVINHYSGEGVVLPFGLDAEQTSSNFSVISLLLGFILVFFIVSLLIKYNLSHVIKTWFLIVVMIALAVSLNAFFFNINDGIYYAAIMAIILGLFKIYRHNVIIHNTTELLIYPGIAVVLIPILNIWGLIILLIFISIYDAWAVWKSKIMQKMAKYQMTSVGIFGGFLIPSVDAKTRMEIDMLRQKYMNKKMPDSVKHKKFKINFAILGGGDVVFPIIAAGVFMNAFPAEALFGIPGLIPALFVIGGALAGLTYLFFTTEKGKAYPAMPYITIGIFLSLIIWGLLGI